MIDPLPVISFLNHFSYIGVFSSIVVSGYILPVPEEIVLITIGYLSASGLFPIWAAVFVSFLATLSSDIFLYSLAKRDSTFIRRFKLKMQRSSFVRSLIEKPNSIGKAVFLMRFFVGLRFLGPIAAGIMDVSLSKFIFFDCLALLLYVPFFAYIGYHFNTSFLPIISRVDTVRHIIFIAVLSIISFLFLQLVTKNLWKLGSGEREVAEEEA